MKKIMNIIESDNFLTNTELLNEIARLRQGLWDCATIAGMDTDGDKTPKALVSDIVKLAIDEVTNLRKEYDA